MALRNRSGKWNYRFVIDNREYSGTTDLDATGRNRNAAEAIEAEHRQAIREGRKPRQRLQARRFSDAQAEYIRWCEAEHRDRPATARRIAVSFASLGRALGDLMVAAVGPLEIERYKTWRIADHKVRDVTLRHDLHALSGFFRWAERMGYAAGNPVHFVRIPSDKDAVRCHVLTADEERRYFEAAAKYPDLHDLGRIMIQQGLRPDEVLHLTAADVDLAAGTAMVRRSKTAAGRRTITLTAESRSILARRMTAAVTPVTLAASLPLWRCSASGLAKWHQRALMASGCDFCLYDARHSFATRLAQAGVDIATLAAILGHASLRLVQRYVHPTAEHQREAMVRYEASQQAEREGAIQ